MNKNLVIALSGLIVLSGMVVGIVVSPAYGLGLGIAAAASLAVGAYARRRRPRRG